MTIQHGLDVSITSPSAPFYSYTASMVTQWIKANRKLADMPLYKLGNPTAMLSAVAWNYATAFFQIRIFAVGENDELRSYSYSRNSDGWAPVDRGESIITSRTAAKLNVPLSTVAAVILENECNPKDIHG
ncbi:hypothetical protein F4804DRAFT_313293 [Jackrogersella minutella]|nr:hypothetical protein F4804DRAFT_313293 [Jackrogersella minutella]